jgi:hypothetical protein
MKSLHRLLDSYPDSLLDEPGAQPAKAIPITGLLTVLSQDVHIMHLIQSSARNPPQLYLISVLASFSICAII